MARVADVIVGRLRDAGVRMIFGVPGGGGNLDLIEAAGRGGLPFVLTSTETGGAMAAIAQAEITGAPGACLTTLGPGAASVVNGVACAFLERAPVVVFTDNYSAADRERYAHQRLDQAALFRGITIFSGSLAPERAFASIDSAFQALEELPIGPVHLDCPGGFNADSDDVLFGPDGVSISETVVSCTRTTGPAGVRESREGLLAKARKPLLIVGLGARRREHAEGVREICRRLRVPAMTTYKAKGVVPETDPWCAGVFTNASIEQRLIDESDLVIGIGLDDVEFLPRPWTATRSVVYGPEPSSVTQGLRECHDHLRRSAWEAETVQTARTAALESIAIPTAGLSAQRVVQVAAARLALESRVTVDAGAHMFPATMLWPVSEPSQMLISNGLSTMGFALPAAIGAALLERDRTVVALTGDGGLLMCMGELLTAVRERLKIIVIVFNDASLSLIEIKQQARKLAPAGVALGAMDWAAVARGFGLAGFVADNEETLDRAITAALGVPGPSLIEARIDRSNYGATMRAIRG